MQEADLLEEECQADLVGAQALFGTGATKRQSIKPIDLAIQ